MSDNDPRPDAPTPGPHDEVDGGPLDLQQDPRVEAVLHALTAALSQPPDELTRRRHLAAMREAVRAQHRRRALLRVGRVGVMAATLLVALAVTGSLPDPLQRSLADAATLVGVTLPAPAPAMPTADEEPHTPADGADPGADDGPADGADPGADDGPADGADPGADDGPADDVGHAPDHTPPTRAPSGGNALGPTADRDEGGVDAPTIGDPGKPETATDRSRPTTRGQRPTTPPSRGPMTATPGRTDAGRRHGEAPGLGRDTRGGDRHPRDHAEAGRDPSADRGARPAPGG